MFYSVTSQSAETTLPKHRNFGSIGASNSMSSPVAAPPGAWRRLRKNPEALIAFAVLVFIAASAIFGPLIHGVDARATSSEQFAPPSARHLFGTDVNGRDVFARVLDGARVSLLVGLSGALVSFFIGTTYGMISGYAGGKTDALMMRFVEK